MDLERGEEPDDLDGDPGESGRDRPPGEPGSDPPGAGGAAPQGGVRGQQGGEPDDGRGEAYESEDEEDDDLEAEREETGESVTIEISGLSLYTHHGVSKAEREVGQRLVLDLRLDLGEIDATVTDSIDDTVDYGEVCQLVALVAQQRSHKTLERLCGAIADRLLGDFPLEGVWVKATKPEPPIALSVDEVSVEVWREAEE
jgi:7,8-dihydroneopterin aldolase/epimerase/oxygenase